MANDDQARKIMSRCQHRPYMHIGGYTIAIREWGGVLRGLARVIGMKAMNNICWVGKYSGGQAGFKVVWRGYPWGNTKEIRTWHVWRKV